MKKHYETSVEDTDKLISVAGPVLDYKSWYEQYRKLMEEQAQRKYGLYTPTSEGDDDDFPSISGMIARYSASGLTNEQMAENPVWKDLTGNGHDLQMKNFAWGGMSGVGGYVDNWNSSADWGINNYWVNSHTDHKLQLIKASTVVQMKSNNIYNAENVYKNILNVNGLTEAVNKGSVGGLRISATDPITSKAIKTFSFDTDGVIQISFDDVLQDYCVVYFVYGNNTNDIDITIEQLPLYPGALVFDGVDDYGTCDNFPILTKEKGYTVVALRQWITRGERALGLVSNVKDWLNNGAFLLEYRNIQADHLNKPISFGAIGSEMDLPHILTYQTSKSYNGVSITTGNFEGTDVLHVGKLAPTNVGTCINAAIWELVFLDHDATEEELTKIKDYFVKTYPWLFPDQAWTVTGKTNEDEDRATIANITGNGNDLVLSNFGFAEGSGYGLYKQNFSKIQWTSSSARVEVTKTNSSFNITEVKSIAIQLYYLSKTNEVAFTVPSIKVRVVGLTDGQSVNYRYFVDGVVNHFLISSDGIYDLPAFEFPAKGNYYGFEFTKIQSSCNITIEQIPEYEGYLVTDGVDDKVQSSSFTMNEDWTIVGDWELLSNVQINCGIVKSQNVYLYNTANGLLISINNPRSLQSFGTKSLHAICSDGRLYDRNWVEYEYTADQNFEIVKSSLNIGFNLNNYAQIAFKNLGIYNNQILSKDDCIKAYNYLQTLKSK
ncbi:hypothetical protein [uncultured phage cr77_1]|uniref:Uncharacterized protein n=1 Tax=uncultured phage cr77_1 TaxID=2986410 RepID=A0AAE7V2I3_9CAUD|nr:hypothetical protein M1M50_gp010 [uncultured phage cr77_1]QWM89754.1 hypothetical protein [uncultured phage cr77_1]